MQLFEVAAAFLLGLIEGLTEFIPVSSTGHLLLVGHFLGFQSTGRTFEVLIQLGAILAILSVYADRLFQIAVALPVEPLARRFVAGVAIAFVPAVIAGVILHDFIKTVLFETPVVICVMLIIGGLSRSGATIVGAMLLGVSKRSAAEFSFYLAMPTMAGAFAYDLLQNYGQLTFDDVALIAVGFVAAFAAAIVVVRTLLDFVSRHGYAPFAWWRILVGTAGLLGLYLVG
jgi:undecaprenyl-diphosphatase